MALTITTTKVKKVTETKALDVPQRWGMFTAKGNRRLTTIAQRAYSKVEKLCADSQPLGNEVRAVLLQYLVDWVKLWSVQSYQEASDTDVREQVGDFHDTLWYAAGMQGDAPWDEHYNDACILGRRAKS